LSPAANPNPSAATVTVFPSQMSPLRSASAIQSCSSFWMRRFKGRAPWAGSKPWWARVVQGVVQEFPGEGALDEEGAQLPRLDLFSMESRAPMCVTWSQDRALLRYTASTEAREGVFSVVELDRIALDPGVMGGKPCVRGTRLTVGTIVGLISVGRSVDDVLEAYPYVERDDVMQALAYAAWRSEEREVSLTPA